MTIFHTPVMLKEVLLYLDVKPNCWYIDCTLGGGGHTKGILKAGGKVLGMDLDPEAILEVAKSSNLKVEKINNHLQAVSDRLILYQTNFTALKEITHIFIDQPILGIFFDLGVSSYQLETAHRGFSFNLDAPLDMRMDPNLSVTAFNLINGLHEKELAELFQKYGDEHFAKPIARKIVQIRQDKKITTTDELARIVLSVRKRGRGDRIHPATRIFQALRIAVNDELNNLKMALPQALEILANRGRLVIIGFHSSEDRIIKNFFKDEYKKRTITILTQKPIIPTQEEVVNNPRSHSGKLRAVEKI